MAFTREQLAKKTQKVSVGSQFSTEVLDAVTTEQIISLGSSASKVSFQSNDTLAGNVEFSINGVDWKDSTAFAANALTSYSSHNVLAIKVTRTSGSGKLSIATR